MFDKFKQINQLRNIQNELQKEKIEVEKDGVKVIINGKMQVEEIKLSSDHAIEKQEEVLKDCFNDAMQKVQMVAAKKMQEMGGI